MEILKVPECVAVKSRNMRWLLYTLFSLVVADGLITQFLVTYNHAQETNPFLQFWVAQDVFLAIKVSGAFLVTLFLWIKYNAKPRLIYFSTVLFIAFYTVIIFWNLAVFWLLNR